MTSTRVRRMLTVVMAIGLVGLGVWGRGLVIRPLTVTAGQLPEELVYVRSTDDVVNAGVLFTPAAGSNTIVIWVHGWGANFHAPTYTNIGRALARQGLAALNVNTRMHDLGTDAARRNGRRVRGGGYWGVQTEQDLDLAAWVDLAQRLGFRRIVLAGHSAGWSAVSWYQARTRDPRITALVAASGTVRAQRLPDQPNELAEARRLVAAGTPDALVRLPNRSFPSYISAATLVDQADTPASLLDFFGVDRQDAGVARVACPILAFYGDRGDVGDDTDLEIVRSAPRRLGLPALRVHTTRIRGADHMYTGAEADVASTIHAWVRALSGAP